MCDVRFVHLVLLGGIIGMATLIACDGTSSERESVLPSADIHLDRRLAMVRQIEAMGISDSATLAAMRRVPRHAFVLQGDVDRAYGNHALPIARGQTISQPFIVAYMTESLHPRPGMNVLEIGTGSGYQAAVLAEIGCRVFSIEIDHALADSARQRLDRLGYERIDVLRGDGYRGWPEMAPFSGIVVTAAPPEIPPALVEQLRPGGRMIMPVGDAGDVQTMVLVTKDSTGALQTEQQLPVRFVPMVRGRE